MGGVLPTDSRFDASRVDRPAPARCFGLFSLRERTAAMDGSLALDTAPGKGTSVEITAPVQPR
jgi:signal transduction histidine kinase